MNSKGGVSSELGSYIKRVPGEDICRLFDLSEQLKSFRDGLRDGYDMPKLLK